MRQQTVEPVFGIIKEARVFRRFSLRGQAKASLEWTLVSLAYKTASRSTQPERNCSSRESAVNRRPAPRQQPPTTNPSPRPHGKPRAPPRRILLKKTNFTCQSLEIATPTGC